MRKLDAKFEEREQFYPPHTFDTRRERNGKNRRGPFGLTPKSSDIAGLTPHIQDEGLDLELRDYANSHRVPQIKFPGLGDQVLAETVMLLLMYDLESHPLINMPCCMQDALRPERQLSISRSAREPDALLYQALADAKAARFRFHVQQAQLCDFV